MYKKYHRSYVSQFKKGVKFKFFYKHRELKCEVVVEPSYINSTHIDIAVIMHVNSNTLPERLSLITLISSSGKLSIVNVEFIEDVV